MPHPIPAERAELEIRLGGYDLLANPARSGVNDIAPAKLAMGIASTDAEMDDLLPRPFRDHVRQPDLAAQRPAPGRRIGNRDAFARAVGLSSKILVNPRLRFAVERNSPNLSRQVLPRVSEDSSPALVPV